MSETSDYESEGKLRARIGLQFFAEGEDGGGAADTDTADSDGFLSAFADDADTAEQQDGEQTGQEETPAGEETTDEENQDAPIEQEGEPPQPDGGQDAPQVVPLTLNGTQIALPAEAVRALEGALGANPVELLEKGMQYESKAERELRLLDEYARASGMTRDAYVAQLEQTAEQERVNREVERVQREFPDTPEEAARTIAQQRIDAQKAADMQRQAEQRAAIQQARERVQQQVAETRRQAEVKAWDAYEKLADVHKAEDIPPRVMELVQKEGMTPTEAHYRYQAEQLEQKLAIENKTKQNAGQTAGSMAGAQDAQDAFLAGFNEV